MIEAARLFMKADYDKRRILFDSRLASKNSSYDHLVTQKIAPGEILPKQCFEQGPYQSSCFPSHTILQGWP